MFERLKKHIELIGIAGVIASLVFVGIQLLLDRRIALGNAYQARAESRMENLRTYLDNEVLVIDLISRIEAGRRPYFYTNDIEAEGGKTGYSIEHQIRHSLLRSIDMVSFDNSFYQRSLGLLDESYWETVVSQLKQARDDDPFVWAIYLNSPVSADFKQYLVEIDNESNGT